MRTTLRRTARVLAVVLAALLLPALGAAVAVPAAFAAPYEPGPDRPVPAAAPIAHDPAKPTAVVVVGERGAIVSDVLAPYEVLASTGRFNVYTVAPRRAPVPLTGGLDLVPDLTFDELAARLGGAADLVVVPALPDVGEPSTAPVTDWLRTQDADGAMLLGVCNGSGVLASAGLLDGRPATAHWLRFPRYESAYPDVDWVRGQRFVDDGDVVTTAGILASIDGTLHVVERLLGPAAADDAATAVGWRHFRADPPVTTQVAFPDPAAIVNAGWRWLPPTIGVALVEGTGEIELAAAFDPYGGQSLATRTLAVSADGAPVRSRHGLLFLPRDDVAGAAADLDRLIVPGAAAAAARPIAPTAGAPEPEYPHSAPGFPFDAAIIDLARTTDVATARWTAKVLELPTGGLELEGPAWPWGVTAVPLLLALVGVGGAVGVMSILRRRRAAAEHGVRPSPGGPP
ncbi:DJ-1/PfpI family protein [Pseudonocardia lacus]|uniref:DJ-1/PfpI family protein n=1 Tax=Pseudonocardia lacus TaxID=2835865 RepID=UPI001BDD726A|nr:DJ-1/PfpI family protein [Pseudonocardia lacus]